MPCFRYRAMTPAGELVTGSLAAPTAAEVMHQVEYLGLIPIDAAHERAGATARASRSTFSPSRGRRTSLFLRAILRCCYAGRAIDAALDLLAADIDIGRLRRTVGWARADSIGGESFGEALADRPDVFPPIYLALARVGEASGTLAPVLEALGGERQRAEMVRRKILEAARYPAFLLSSAWPVLIFFLLFVLPHFDWVLRDSNAKLDPTLRCFLVFRACAAARRPASRRLAVARYFYGCCRRERGQARRAAHRGEVAGREAACDVSCDRLFLPQSRPVALERRDTSAALRILGGMMAATAPEAWKKWRNEFGTAANFRTYRAQPKSSADRGTHAEAGGGIGATGESERPARRILRSKTQRSLDRRRNRGAGGNYAISLVVGGLIMSVMTSLLSVTQIVGS